MSVMISGALTDGAGIPMSGCHIILKSRVNTFRGGDAHSCRRGDRKLWRVLF
ncbi:prophage tail fiber N-terminal domain-containing protein [Escherichia coli]